MVKQYVCTMCGYVGLPKRTAKGSLGIEIILWLCFLIPGLIYSMWRLASYHNACPECKNASMIPTDSPKGRKLVEENRA